MRFVSLIPGLLVAGCAAAPVAPPALAPPLPKTGLERVLGETARTLTGLFGRPQLDVTEGPGRKLQFGGAVCVLDLYLYPRAQGGEPIVTYLDARQPDGRDIDRASCVAALAAAAGR